MTAAEEHRFTLNDLRAFGELSFRGKWQMLGAAWEMAQTNEGCDWIVNV